MVHSNKNGDSAAMDAMLKKEASFMVFFPLLDDSSLEAKVIFLLNGGQINGNIVLKLILFA